MQMNPALKHISNYGLLFWCMQKQIIQGLATQKQHFFKGY